MKKYYVSTGDIREEVLASTHEDAAVVVVLSETEKMKIGTSLPFGERINVFTGGFDVFDDGMMRDCARSGLCELCHR